MNSDLFKDTFSVLIDCSLGKISPSILSISSEWDEKMVKIKVFHLPEINPQALELVEDFFKLVVQAFPQRQVKADSNELTWDQFAQYEFETLKYGLFLKAIEEEEE